jgi:glycosyltransferase involved in cell wall biosynthesis
MKSIKKSKKTKELLSASETMPEYTNLEYSCLEKRIDLKYNFDVFDSNTLSNIKKWLNQYGLSELKLRKQIREVKFSPKIDKNKFNLISLNSDYSGVGISANNFIDYFKSKNRLNGIAKLNFSSSLKTEEKFDKNPHPPIQLKGKNIFFINGDLMRAASHRFTKQNFKDCYKIGYWAWEMENLNPTWQDGFNFVDEIWSPSNFTAESIAKMTRKPIKVVPIPVNYHLVKKSAVNSSVSKLIKMKPYFLFMFDYLSDIERKNVLNLIKIFKSFEKLKDAPKLVIKSVNSDLNPESARNVRRQLGTGSKNIVVIDKKISKLEIRELLENALFYLSIHRSEGFGMTLAESMLLGTPVICTGYSGNLDFTNNENSILIDYKLTKPKSTANSIYRFQDAFWAEPDVSQTREIVKEIHSDPAIRASYSKIAKQSVHNYIKTSNVLLSSISE